MISTPHLKVQVWIYCRSQREGWLFLVLRTLPQRGGFWQPVTGSVEKGESIEFAALREAREETGLCFSCEPRPLGKPFEFQSRGRKVKEYGFSLEASLFGQGTPKIILDLHEHDDSRWVTPQEALSMISYPSNAQMLRCLLKELK